MAKYLVDEETEVILGNGHHSRHIEHDQLTDVRYPGPEHDLVGEHSSELMPTKEHLNFGFGKVRFLLNQLSVK